MAKACPDFAPLVEGNCVDPEPLEQPLAEELRQLTNPKQWLMALHLTCTYLAAKNIDKVSVWISLLLQIQCAFQACCATARVRRPKQYLMALYLTFTYLAAKNIDKVNCIPFSPLSLLLHANASVCMTLSSWDLKWLLPAAIVCKPQRLL